MDVNLTDDQRDRNRRWANVARRTHALHATEVVRHAIEDTIPRPTDPLLAAEEALDELETIPGEPEPLDTAQVNP